MPEIRQITPLAAPNALIPTLANFGQLPILPGTRESVLASLQRRNATAISVAASCQQDPVLKLHLWLSVNETLQRSGNELHHLAHGISLLGLPKTEAIVRNASQMITPNSGYLECLMHSKMSEHLAHTLITSDPSERECWSTSALFARCHEWALWHHFPNHMTQRQGLLANPTLNELVIDLGLGLDDHNHAIETLLFGQALQESGTQLSQTLPLPNPLKRAWSVNWDAMDSAAQACIEGTLRQWIQENPERESEFFSKSVRLWLINRLCQALALAPQSQDCQQLMAILATQSVKPVDTIMSIAHQVAVSSRAPVIDWPHPASRLLQHWQAQQLIEPLAISLPKGSPKTTDNADQTNLRAPTSKSVRDTSDNDSSVQKTLTAFRELAQVDENGVAAELPMTARPVTSSRETPPKQNSVTLETMPDFLQLPEQRSDLANSGITADSPPIAPQDNPQSPQYRPPKPETPPPTQFRNNTVLDEHLKRLLERGDQFNNLNQLLLFAVDALAEGVGLERVGMMIIHNKHSLRSHYWRGLEKSDPLKNLAIELDSDAQAGIIGQLFKQPAGLNITSANAALVKSRSPATLQPLLEENSTALMSLFRDKSPIGIVYGASANFEAKQFQQFKRVCNATSKAISAFARRQYRRNNTKATPSKTAQ